MTDDATVVPIHPLVAPLTDAFSDRIEIGEISVEALPGETSVELQGDDWTLHIEGWPIALAFVALDDEPATREECLKALQTSPGALVIGRVQQIDREHDGAISGALATIRDPASNVLSELLRAEPA